jgi:hypothetical protein
MVRFVQHTHVDAVERERGPEQLLVSMAEYRAPLRIVIYTTALTPKQIERERERESE